MDQRVARVTNFFRQSGHGGDVQVEHLVLHDEKRGQRLSEIGLARSFLAEKVEDGKLICEAFHHVAETRRKPISQPHFAVVAIHLHKLLQILLHRHRLRLSVHKAALPFVSRTVLQFLRRRGNIPRASSLP